MNKKHMAFEEARQRIERCKQWIKRFMVPGQPKPFSKDELFQLASAEMDLTRSNFNDAWFLAIHETGRDDWCRPAPRARKRKN